ncbi:RHS repeat-associated core domain-containing protein, partial [Bacillus cereus]
GYRYYMSWLGRWLNPDPAGTVDGLNLYRMVRNNPINLIDPDGNAPQDSKDIVGNFKKGDLIYGLSHPRIPYLEDVYLSLQDDTQMIGSATVNDYNNTIAEVIMRTKANSRFYGIKNSIGLARSIKVPDTKTLNKMIHSHYLRKLPWWKDYFKAGEKNVKFHIPSIYKEVAENYGKDFYHQYADASGYVTPKLLWKRGSKLTLEMAASNKNTQRHFVLDGLDIEHVVNKTKGMGNSTGLGESVTASELRYVYRNYDKLKGRILFYRNKEKLDKAPWEENPSLWAKYQPTNRPIKKPGEGNCLGCLLMRRR